MRFSWSENPWPACSLPWPINCKKLDVLCRFLFDTSTPVRWHIALGPAVFLSLSPPPWGRPAAFTGGRASAIDITHVHRTHSNVAVVQVAAAFTGGAGINRYHQCAPDTRRRNRGAGRRLSRVARASIDTTHVGPDIQHHSPWPWDDRWRRPCPSSSGSCTTTSTPSAAPSNP